MQRAKHVMAMYHPLVLAGFLVAQKDRVSDSKSMTGPQPEDHLAAGRILALLALENVPFNADFNQVIELHKQWSGVMEQFSVDPTATVSADKESLKAREERWDETEKKLLAIRQLDEPAKYWAAKLTQTRRFDYSKSRPTIDIRGQSLPPLTMRPQCPCGFIVSDTVR